MKTIEAQPYPYALPSSQNSIALMVIDMQRDFIEPGGFGSVLGNDVEPLRKIIPTVKQLLDTFHQLGLPIIHPREGHQPDLSDCPASKIKRGGEGGLKIGDSGPMGCILVWGEKEEALSDGLLQPIK